MATINSTRSVFQNVDISETQTDQRTAQDGRSQARRQCFAIVAKLEKRGMDADAIWEYAKAEFKKTSRSDFTELEWVTFVARLDAAQRDKKLFEVLSSDIQPHQQPRQKPMIDILRDILRTQNTWVTMENLQNEVKNHCGYIENAARIKSILRQLYRQKQIVYKQIGAAEWWRWQDGTVS